VDPGAHPSDQETEVFKKPSGVHAQPNRQPDQAVRPGLIEPETARSIPGHHTSSFSWSIRKGGCSFFHRHIIPTHCRAVRRFVHCSDAAPRRFIPAVIVALALLGMKPEEIYTPARLGAFIEGEGKWRKDPVYGRPNKHGYVAGHTIAKYASTRVISLFKFKDAEPRQALEALKNGKLSGQASNATFVMRRYHRMTRR
jgi:hypothetical protein